MKNIGTCITHTGATSTALASLTVLAATCIAGANREVGQRETNDGVDDGLRCG
ncbi:MAG: hypothetical protein Q7S01_03240 [bacterium]|nr:hypothetical protein [bacterium]